MSGLRILIADDHEVARQGIRALLESHPGWEVCAEARDGREAVELATNSKPDIVLHHQGDTNGFERVPASGKRNPALDESRFDPARTGSYSTPRRRQDQQGSSRRPQTQREDGRDPPDKSHAET